MSGSGDGQSRIVVGVDGSEGSKHALRWAARQAEFTGRHAGGRHRLGVPGVLRLGADHSRRHRLRTVRPACAGPALDEVFGADRPARLETRVVARHPALALVEASEGADLLVVGSRGYGGFADALLGSVSTYCIHHAHCPVTVIRPADHQRK